MTNPSLLETASLPEFFRGEVCKAIRSVNVKASPHAEFYLVNLLTHFAHTEKLYDRNEKGELVDQALALRLFDALLADRNDKIPILKKMGDIALYISGFFAESLLGKIIDMDYYIQMGHTAYASLSNIVDDDHGKSFRELFEELSFNFIRFVNVISEVADSTNLRSDQDLLRLYERWLATGSERAKELLVREGIVPQALVCTKVPH